MIRWAWLGLVVLVGGCEGAPPAASDDGGVPSRTFGETCLSGADCVSGLCLQVEAGRAICTLPCDAASDCPGGRTWGCVQAEEDAARVCGCRPEAAAEVCGDGIDNECNGRVDDCRICSGVPVPDDSHDHCGACDRACRLDQECSGGECGCPVGRIECGGRCVDPDTSTDHCGGCGNECPFRGLCVGGACECPDGFPDQCGATCVDTRTSVLHCGACDDACPATLDCVAGECRCASAAAPLYCEGAGCVDPRTDSANCGACGNACPAAQRCIGGSCECPTAGQELCAGSCIDVQYDPRNCGSCGTACAAGARCSEGRCVCDSGLLCDGVCVTRGDPANCGACGRVCRADQYCDGVGCRCASGVECGGACIDTNSDRNNCGACGNVCGTGMFCSWGRCACESATPYECVAFGGCFDLRTDPMHCGTCTTVCAAAQICSSSSCRCPIAGQTLCPSTGTCRDLLNDPMNCGTCGNVCPAATSCTFGSCRCPGGGSATYCASIDACVDVATDPLHCGACDRACPSGTTCTSGTCRCDTAGQTLCGTQCVDLQTDVTHCGSCTNVCAAGRTCTAGACACPAPVAATPVRLTTSITGSDDPAIAAAPDRAAIVWIESSTSGRSLMMAIVGPTGARILGTDLVLVPTTTRGLTSPSVTWNGAEFAVAWGQQDASTSTYRAMFQRVGADGTPIGATITASAAWPGGASADQVAVAHQSASGYAIAGAGGDTVYFQMLGGDGTGTLPLAVPITMAGGYSAPRGLELISATDGRFAITRSSASAGTRVQVVNADGSVTTSPLAPTSDGYAHDLAWDGVTWVMPLSTWVSGTGFRPVVARGPTLATTVVVRAASSTRLVEPSLTLWGREALAVSTVYPDSGSGSGGTLEIARVTLPAGASGAMTVVAPSAALGGVTTVSRAWPLEAAHFDANRALVVWSDTRWGQLEIYVMALTVASCL